MPILALCLMLLVGSFSQQNVFGDDSFLDLLKNGSPENLAKARAMLKVHPALANIRDTRYASSNGRFALHYLAQWNKVRAVQLLLEFKADLNIRDPFQRTPIHFAALAGSDEVFEMLKAAGADMKAVDKAGLDSTELKRVREIDWAIWTNDGKTLDFLLKQYPHLINVPGLSGDPPLVRAASLGRMEVILKHQPDVNALNCYGRWSALHSAAKSRQVVIVELLLAHHADVSLFDLEGNSALHDAVNYSDPFGGDADLKREKRMVSLLLKHGADPLALNARGESPIHLGRRRGTKLDELPAPASELCPKTLRLIVDDPFR